MTRDDASPGPPPAASGPASQGERERHYQRLFQLSVQGYSFCRVEFDAAGRPVDWRYVEVNEAFRRLMGLPEDVAGRTVTELFPGLREREPALFETYGRVARTGQPAAFDAHVAERDLWLRVSAYCPQPDHFVAMFDDVTALRRGEAALRESRLRLALALEGSGQGVWDWDVAAGTLTVDRRWREIAGVPAEGEETTADSQRWVASIHPDDAEAVTAGATELVAGRRQRYDFEYRLRAGDGWRWVHSSARAAARGEDGVARRITGTLADISERKAADEARLRAEVERREALQERTALVERLRQAEKLEAVGRLAGGVAHDFNNLLSVILTCSAALRDDTAAGRPIDPEDVAEIHLAGERARDLTRQLLAFARKQVVAPVRLDLNEAVRGAERLLRRVLGEQVALEVRLGPGPLAAICDPGQVEQILVNLALNARDAMPRGGQLVVETSCAAAAGAGGDPAHPEGRWVTLCVADTGPGLSPEVQAHLFEPFFTTKEVGKGTGLGLATVHGIVGQAGGHIHVSSDPSRGTAFRVCLPQVDPAAPADGLAAAVRARGGSETLLVVEDDPQVRTAAERALRGAGYRVLVAGDGAEALAQAATLPPGALALVVADVIMPGPNGREVVEALRRRHGPLRALFVSGYPGDLLGSDGVLDRSLEFLPKPFTGDQLRARVRDLLDAE